MTNAEPIMVCNCGYMLLDGQDCPECGRPFGQARPITRGVWAYLIVSVITAVLFVVPFGMFYVVGLMNPGDSEAGMLVLIPAVLTWLVSGVFAIFGVVMTIAAWRKGVNKGSVAISLLLTIPPLILICSAWIYIWTKH